MADVTTWTPRCRYDLVLSAFALPRGGSGRDAALRMAMDALSPGGTIIIAELDVSMTPVFGAEAGFIGVDEMGCSLSGLEAVSVERTQVPHSHGDRPAGPADSWAVIGIARRPRHR